MIPPPYREFHRSEAHETRPLLTFPLVFADLFLLSVLATIAHKSRKNAAPYDLLEES
jgi:hypothetical protein